MAVFLMSLYHRILCNVRSNSLQSWNQSHQVNQATLNSLILGKRKAFSL